MAGLSSPGIGSGLDINGLITKLMSVEQQPLTNLTRKEANFQAQLSALGSVQGAISSLQTAVSGLNSTSKFLAQKAGVGDATVLSASASSIATPGSYSIAVGTLAQAQSLSSAGNASTSATIGSVGDTLTIQFGTYGAGSPASSFTLNPNKGALTVTLGAGQNNLTGIRDAINAANGSVSASIINDGSASPYHLVISSKDTGAANGMKISTSAGLTSFAYDPLVGGNPLTQPSGANAQDATLTINGIAVTSPTNTLADAIHGVTLNLLKGGGATTTLSVSKDTSGAQTAVQSFVTAYNATTKALASVSSYDAATKTGGPLLGDSVVRSAQSQLRTLLNSPIDSATGGLTSLADIGVAFQKDGSLTLDSSKLQSVISDSSKDISTLFAAVGKSTDSLSTVVGSTDATKPGSYAVSVTQLATQGSALGSFTVVDPTVITSGSNDTLSVIVDGAPVTVTLRAGSYTPTQLAAEIQSEINGAAAISSLGSGVSVTLSGGVLSLVSNRYGSASNVSVTGGTAQAITTGTTTSSSGVDVAGTIGGVAATGSGQKLIGTGDAAGLQLSINGGVTGSRGTVNFSQGYAYQLNKLTTDMLASSGLFAGRTKGINSSILDIGTQRDALNLRLAAIEARYRKQFTALDSLIASMQSTQTYLTQQLAQIASITTQVTK